MWPKSRAGEGHVGPCTLTMVLRLQLNTNLAGGNSRTLTRGDYQRKPQTDAL